VKRARELIYTAERQASRDVGLAGLRLKPGSSQYVFLKVIIYIGVHKEPQTPMY
jgi:hypothetical protein